jgi:uncharacterized membrane protein YfcA
MNDLGATSLTLLGLAVLAGAGTQRITGLGFALVSSPFLVLLLGPFTGVLVANALSLVTNLVVLLQTWRAVELRKALLLAVPALLAVLPGAWVARNLPPPVLAIAVGTLVLAALLLVMFSEKARILHGTRGAIAAGAMSGFMNVTAGVGGPAVTLYALSSRWSHRPFVATVQLYFALLNAGSLAAKGLPQLPSTAWAVAGAALALGVVAGHRLTEVVSPVHARRLVAGLAIVGSLATVVKGVVEL